MTVSNSSDGSVEGADALAAAWGIARPAGDAGAAQDGPKAIVRSVASGLRLRVLVPLAVALLLLIATFVAIFMADAARRQTEAISRTATTVEQMVAQQATDGTQLMRSIMEMVIRDERLATAFRSADRQTLLELSTPLFNELKAKNRITHFYYILPDRTMLLRVQAPHKHGDRIDRFVLQEAQRTGKPYWGNEQGPLGSYTLRVVYPWFNNGELLGYLEMGIEFEELVHNINALLGADVFVAIDKKFFDRAKWDEAQRGKDHPVDWNEFESVLVLSRTSEIPLPVREHLAGLRERHERLTFETAWDRTVAQAIVLPFNDLRGRQLGELVVLRDVTDAAAVRHRSVIGMAILGIMLGGGLMALFYVLLGRVQKDVTARSSRLHKAQQEIASEQAERRRAEQHLQLEQERNSLLEEQARMAQERMLAKRTLEDRTAALARSLALLNATLDSTADGILAAQYSGSEICFNSQFASMWSVPADMLARGAGGEIIDFMAQQVEDPQQFVARIELLCAGDGDEAFDVLERRDGRTIERYVKPQRIDGKVVGIVINFRDVTERRRVEADLQLAQRELVAKARQAGMAEIATNVLHNVGNVLNSVNVSASVVTRKMQTSQAAGLAKAVDLIDQHADDLARYLTTDVKGKLLPGYLGKLAQAITAEQQGIVDELGVLTRSVDHIKQIVAMQQSYAGPTKLVEPVHACDLVEDALRMNSGALARQRVTVVRDFAEVPPLPLDRHRVLLILVNLINNAKVAMDARPDRAHELRIGVELAPGRRLRISVADNGEGIAADHLTRVFGHGFTTRKDGHGFGLHSCAIAAGEMGGTLTAHSAGLGQGARFVLELPVKLEEIHA
jgi:PAS domain S-box-containing protein